VANVAKAVVETNEANKAVAVNEAIEANEVNKAKLKRQL
jgi:hypothetical protein